MNAHSSVTCNLRKSIFLALEFFFGAALPGILSPAFPYYDGLPLQCRLYLPAVLQTPHLRSIQCSTPVEGSSSETSVGGKREIDTMGPVQYKINNAVTINQLDRILVRGHSLITTQYR